MNLFLLGAPCAGRATLISPLRTTLTCPVLDMDEVIMRINGGTWPSLDVKRTLVNQVIDEASRQDDAVLAYSLLDDEQLSVLSDHGWVVSGIRSKPRQFPAPVGGRGPWRRAGRSSRRQMWCGPGLPRARRWRLRLGRRGWRPCGQGRGSEGRGVRPLFLPRRPFVDHRLVQVSAGVAEKQQAVSGRFDVVPEVVANHSEASSAHLRLLLRRPRATYVQHLCQQGISCVHFCAPMGSSTRPRLCLSEAHVTLSVVGDPSKIRTCDTRFRNVSRTGLSQGDIARM